MGYLEDDLELGERRIPGEPDLSGPPEAALLLRPDGLAGINELPLEDYLYLRMAEGMVAMSEESTDEAIRHFDFVLSLDQETDDQELAAIAEK